MTSAYFSKRKNLFYYKYVDFLVRGFAADAKSLIDIGTASARYLDEWDWIPDRTSLNLNHAYQSDVVKAVVADFFDFTPPQKYDFATCFQVLEHIPNAKVFARKLLATSDNVLISVPYKWPKGSNKDHVHDPVSLWKVRWWFGRRETYRIIVEEPLDDGPKRRRLICYFSNTRPRLKAARKVMRAYE